MTASDLFDTWNHGGTLQAILDRLRGQIEIDEELWCIDGTIVSRRYVPDAPIRGAHSSGASGTHPTPAKSICCATPKANADRDARAVTFDREAYRDRNTIERLIGWLKECRRIFSRFEKTAKDFGGMTKMAFIQRYLRWIA